jgi:hypothetical protein
MYRSEAVGQDLERYELLYMLKEEVMAYLVAECHLRRLERAN